MLAYWHQPRFSSDSVHGTAVVGEAMWDALYEFGADLVLNGHAHWYERYAPQTPDGVADPTYGIRQFTVGTGGRSLRGPGTIDPNSVVRDWSSWGVLKLTLNPSSYDWQFLPVAGSSFTDSGTSTVHPAPGTPTLSTIAVTPANPTIAAGATQQFTATGTYSDASTANLTGSVTWASGTPAKATINSSGLATGVAAGTSTISATLGPVSGSTTLTVTPPVTHTVSGTVTAGGVGVSGAVVWAFDAGTGAYVSGVVTGAGGSYSLGLLPDTYKLWITDAPGSRPGLRPGRHVRQRHGRRPDHDRQDGQHRPEQPGHPHRVRHGDRRWRGGQRGRGVGLRRGHRGLCQRRRDRRRWVVQPRPPPDTYKLWITDAPGSRPGLRPGRHVRQRHGRRPDHDRQDGQHRPEQPGHPHRVRHGDRRWRRGSAGPWCGPSTRAPGPMSAAS